MARSLVSRLPRGVRPLSRRLPLIVASIVLVMMAIVLYQGFRQVHKLASEVAIAHLQAASHQLRATLQTSVARARRDMAQLTHAPALEQAASVFASDSDRHAALAVLNAELHRTPQGLTAVALWSRDDRLLLVAGDTAVARLSPPRMTELAADGDDTTRAAIEPLAARGDSIFVSIVGRVHDPSGRFVASVVEVRHSTRNAAGLDLLRGLVGANAHILLGNARENLWSDFSRPVSIRVTAADSSADEHVADDASYLHSIEPVTGTPWRIMVEVPTRWATARAGGVILEIGTLAVFMMIVGVGIVWLAIHHSLLPLAEITGAVGRLANGRLDERVRVQTDDELGELATAFNSMADHIEESAEQLAARARALETANKELRHAQKMDAVGRLAGGVAHDFNNILTVIDAHAEFALAPSATEATRRDDIEQIRNASRSAARLTRQLLAFSRKQALTPTQLDLNAIVLGLSGMLARVLGQHIAIHTDLADPLWIVRADAGYLEQVIMNLAVNARDAMPEGGDLDFRTSNLDIGPDYRTPAGELVPRGQYVLLTVEDSGTGMPEEVQSRAFEPFFTTKQQGQGTGLGLSTVYGIVKQSGGFIWLYSEMGRGTAFKILLPRSIVDEGEVAFARTSEHRIQSVTARILIVEDQSAVRMAIGRALRDAGFIVVEVSSAEAAEELLARDDKVDLVIADMMMSGKTGAELAAGPLLAGRDIPVIIMSGYSEEFTNREWKLPPNTVFLDKPVAPSDLIRLVNQLLD